MNLVEAVQSCFSQYVGFSGRARRSEYWFFVLFNFIVTIVSSLIDSLLGTQFISGLCSLAILLPGFAVALRRLHDTGKSGWWVLISLVPIVGSILLIVWMCKDSEGDNAYGPCPK